LKTACKCMSQAYGKNEGEPEKIVDKNTDEV
jgi:hypothetical protein